MATRPDPPTNLTATGQDKSLTLSWTPATSGGIVSSFTVIGVTVSRSISKTVSSNISTTSLVAKNGISYIPIVFANGPPGSGSSRPIGSATPVGSPTNLRVRYNKTIGNALISWRAPTVDSDSPITYYNIYNTIILSHHVNLFKNKNPKKINYT